MLFEWLPACALMFLSSQILLDANTIQLGSLPDGVYAASPTQASHEQAVYEVCVCPSGKIYLSPAESTSTCQAMSNICLWSWPGSSDRGKPSKSAPQRFETPPFDGESDGDGAQTLHCLSWVQISTEASESTACTRLSDVGTLVPLTSAGGAAFLKSGISHTNRNISTTLESEDTPFIFLL